MALGAGRSGIMRAVIGGPLLETVLGLAIGCRWRCSSAVPSALKLYGLGGQNPIVWSVTIGNPRLDVDRRAAIPARRAASIRSSRALRGE
jgi:hypothetical protein